MHKLLRSAQRTAFLLVLMSLGSIAVLAQSSTGTVKGKIQNMKGERIAGATVTARQGSKDIKSATADSKGEFQISGLDAGYYNMVFDAKGYSTGVKYSVEVKPGKTVDLGDRLIMQVDQGTQVIIKGSVFFKSGHSVAGAKVDVERIGADGSTKKLGTIYTDISGEFSFRRPEGTAKYRFTAHYKDSAKSKEIEVDNAAIYRLAINLEVDREND